MRIILNLLKKIIKKIILIDRFVDSTIAYQHYGMGINKKLIDRLNKIILNNLKPDLVFLNVVNKKNLTQRLNLRRKRIDTICLIIIFIRKYKTVI